MKKNGFKILKATSLFIIIGLAISCSYEYKSHSEDKKERNKKLESFEDKEIIESESQKEIGGQMMHVSNKSVKKIKASFVDVTIKIRKGKLYINDGADNFVDAKFIYDKYDLKSIMEYSENDDRGDLYIRLTGNEDGDINIDTDDDETKCIIQLSNDVAMNLRVEFGAGYGKFNLNNLLLEDLELRLGAGKFDIDLSNSTVRDIDIEAGIGKFNLDLSGDRKHDLDVEILGGIGELDIKLPEKIGVRAEIKGILGDIDAFGFKKRDRVYTNKSYGKTDINIEIDIKAGLGGVNLILVD